MLFKFYMMSTQHRRINSTHNDHTIFAQLNLQQPGFAHLSLLPVLRFVADSQVHSMVHLEKHWIRIHALETKKREEMSNLIISCLKNGNQTYLLWVLIILFL